MPEPSIAKHLATINLWREADNSIHVTFAEARGVADELGESNAPLYLCAMSALRAAQELRRGPIDMILYCPRCGKQHIDAPLSCSFGVGCREAGVCYAAAHDEPDRCDAWNNPPHRSHLCLACACIWRPADVETNGVKAITTAGKADNWPATTTEISHATPIA